VIFGFLAAIFGLIDFLGSRSIRAQAPAWPHAIAGVVLLNLATLNMFVHSRDAWTSVVPWGLTLSAATVLVLMFTAWMGRALVYSHRVGALNEIRRQNIVDSALRRVRSDTARSRLRGGFRCSKSGWPQSRFAGHPAISVPANASLVGRWLEKR
jgi:hypothetical protein